MSAIPEIRHRIKVVEDTRKITRAMYLISSAKMQKAMKMHERNLVFFRRVREDMRFIIESNDCGLSSSYFQHRPGKRAVYLVISGDKGMCGAYNTDVLRLAEKTIREGNHEQVFLFTIGLTAYLHFQRLGMDPDVHYLHIAQSPSLPAAREVTVQLCDMYENDLFDEAYVVFTNMVNSRQFTPQVLRLLPILREDFAEIETMHPYAGALEYVPSDDAALHSLAVQHLIGLTYSACAQSYASEHCARMTAMDASTRNADEMLGRLRLEYNRARQAAITQELTEIISGASSVRQA